jgi:hypothetical protein
MRKSLDASTVLQRGPGWKCDQKVLKAANKAQPEQAWLFLSSGSASLQKTKPEWRARGSEVGKAVMAHSEFVPMFLSSSGHF